MSSVLTMKEVAERLKCSTSKVRSLIDNGKLKALDLGDENRHCYRVTEEQYAAFTSTPAPVPQPLPEPDRDGDLVVKSFLGKRRKRDA